MDLIRVLLRVVVKVDAECVVFHIEGWRSVQERW
jgi:hypothetical protein